MYRPVAIAAGVLIGAVSLILLGLAAVSTSGDLVGSDLAWLEPFAGSAAAVGGGVGLAIAALAIGIGMGRWFHPRPVPTEPGRRHEGLQG